MWKPHDEDKVTHTINYHRVKLNLVSFKVFIFHKENKSQLERGDGDNSSLLKRLFVLHCPRNSPNSQCMLLVTQGDWSVQSCRRVLE